MGFPIWAKHLTDIFEYGLFPMWAMHHVGALHFMNKLSQKPQNTLVQKLVLNSLASNSSCSCLLQIKRKYCKWIEVNMENREHCAHWMPLKIMKCSKEMVQTREIYCMFYTTSKDCSKKSKSSVISLLKFLSNITF